MAKNSEINYVSSLKKSIRRSLWQIKGFNHEHFALSGIHSIIEDKVVSLGIDPNDRNFEFLVMYGTKPIPQFDLLLCFTSMEPEAINFTIMENHVNSEKEPVWLPKIMFKEFATIPPIVYLSVEKTSRTSIVFLEKAE